MLIISRFPYYDIVYVDRINVFIFITIEIRRFLHLVFFKSFCRYQRIMLLIDQLDLILEYKKLHHRNHVFACSVRRNIFFILNQYSYLHHGRLHIDQTNKEN